MDEKMRREKTSFAAQQPVLLQRYPGEYVAIHEGYVIDHDPDRAMLHRRVVKIVGAVPVLMKRVDEPINRELIMRSPRLERLTSCCSIVSRILSTRARDRACVFIGGHRAFHTPTACACR